MPRIAATTMVTRRKDLFSLNFLRKRLHKPHFSLQHSSPQHDSSLQQPSPATPSTFVSSLSDPQQLIKTPLYSFNERTQHKIQHMSPQGGVMSKTRCICHFSRLIPFYFTSISLRICSNSFSGSAKCWVPKFPTTATLSSRALSNSRYWPPKPMAAMTPSGRIHH